MPFIRPKGPWPLAHGFSTNLTNAVVCRISPQYFKNSCDWCERVHAEIERPCIWVRMNLRAYEYHCMQMKLRHLNLRAYAYEFTCIWIYVRMNVWIYMHKRLCAYEATCEWIYVRMNMWMYMHTLLWAYEATYTWTYVHLKLRKIHTVAFTVHVKSHSFCDYNFEIHLWMVSPNRDRLTSWLG